MTVVQAQYAAAPSPKVAILLGTYHGQHHLVDQLNSIFHQSHGNWAVYASDDGSNDGTHAILARYRKKWGPQRLSIYSGPSAGFSANFLFLTCHADIESDYYAYADQDDVWAPEKLERAVGWLKTIDSEVPALYCSRTRLVDAANEEIGLSPLFAKPPSFANALVQNIGGGNTMVFNNATRRLLRGAGDEVDVITHDWWVYLVVTGCGGKVFYDAYPAVRYRQHDGNLVGMNSGWMARLQRVRMLLDGHFKAINQRHVNALERLHGQLTTESVNALSAFTTARKSGLVARLLGMKRSGIYRQTFFGNLALIVAILINKI